ncbi:MAG: hypothetical protein IJ128_05345, partial [Firmicutes bacterium]|nr:hypothetical protein [Bacillota bacterium]
EFEQSLEDYLQRLDYSEDWTWFDEDGKALSDEDVAAMTASDKAKAFIEGRCSKGSSDASGMKSGIMGGRGGKDGFGGDGKGPDGRKFDGQGPDGKEGKGEKPDGLPHKMDGQGLGDQTPDGQEPQVGTPDAGTTQSAGSSTDSQNYSSYEDMLKAYQEDIASIESGDDYSNNIVELYDPLNWIGAEGTEGPTWSRILMGASEGDMSMMDSLNLQLAWMNAGTDAQIEWQWDGGHVPSEILGDSLALYVDTMYGKYVDGAVKVEKAEVKTQTENGDAEEADGTDISKWVSLKKDGSVSFSLADAASYRTAGASKAIPGFDVMDYGQEDYVFGNSSQDARHWDKYVLKVLEEHGDTLKKLFNAGD